MQSFKTLVLYTFILLSSQSVFSQTEGFYKDLFMDGGVGLTSKTSLPAAEALNFKMEFLATSDPTLQTNTLIVNDYDQNGFLLYPDGAPRFAMIYTNGGGATDHGNSMGEEGRKRIRTFYYNGGSYTGSCAGAFIASLSYNSEGIHEPYYHIWPGRTQQGGLVATYTGHFIPPDSPLLEYSTFGNDLYISNVYHNYGAFARENLDYPPDTEVLLRYDYPAKAMHNQPSCWAYIEDEQSGRVVVIGSHPESVTSGERLDLMKAILSYALDGIAAPQIKANLVNDQTRLMDKSSSDNKPDYAQIGDRQYHHFYLNIPEGSRNFSLNLSGTDNCDLELYLNRNDFAFKGNTDFSEDSSGTNKNIFLADIAPGEWYIGVKCATTVSTAKMSWGYNYTGNLHVLNGIEYAITASWDTTATAISHQTEQPERFKLLANYPNPFNAQTTINYQLAKAGTVKLSVFNELGQQVKALASAFQPAGKYQYTWDAADLSSGVYFIRLMLDDHHEQFQKAILIK